MKVYKKLVRDKIPEIMINNGVTPIIRNLNRVDYKVELKKKLQEEVNEFLESEELEELADIEEVLRAIVDTYGISHEKFDSIRQEKAKEKGAFKKKIFLEKEI